MVTPAGTGIAKILLELGSLYTTQKTNLNYLVREDPKSCAVHDANLLPPSPPLLLLLLPLPYSIQKTKKKRLPQLVPLFGASRRSKAVAAAVFFHVLGDVLPWKLAATTAVVCSFCAELLGVSDATAKEPNLLVYNQHHPR
jgi:hypothetical protein